eukprot:c13151_g1_i5.p1 GENE.c13151_g1_i5~~c13151_g1_i5.p1  ORF type:complete len:147 (-),score=45.19 c13151_g1_i5:308-748(-)
MATGVKMGADTVVAFNNMKLGRSKVGMMKMVIDNKGFVVVESCFDEAEFAGLSHIERHEKMMSKLDSKQCAYFALDFNFTDENQMVQHKMCLVKWVPGEGPRAHRLVYAASAEVLKGALSGIAKHIQANDLSDTTYHSILATFGRS